MRKITGLLPIFVLLALAACNNEPRQSEETTGDKQEVKLVSPAFDADSAYAFAKAQVDFGPRIPSTSAHAACAAYLQRKLQDFGAEVRVQTAAVKTYDGKSHQLKNILASFNKERKARVLVTAHWDARPFSDQDPDSSMRNKPFDAANDGASGVAVILEMARQIQQKQPNVGVDFILWDLEDYGDANDSSPEELTWCLGSQYWAKSELAKQNKPLYGINLDMVGGGNAQFTQDEVSRQYAADVVKKVWDIGNEIGYSSYFVYMTSGRLIDDHAWVNKAGIPCIDIIHYSDNAGFYMNWHTQLDNLANLDRNTLKAVGQTVLETIYREQPAP
ncbi:glutamine cyclotransferase [Pedobacter yulinensis]|uniref:Glutamine cyclotransferase n=1 Tax=Pedobacter yulinensis TaxID=2126353 RepID=A0A2T3HNZ3_9SPHI|nr:M28 family peptidase [Pedobacter yulinensis]PST84178.1 glutamine cyclotransferase [Pedobacter yulinensis]